MARYASLSTLLAVLCTATSAQQPLDPARIHPVTAPVRDAGTFDWNTKRWTSGPQAGRQLASTATVYRNDCTWTGGAYYFGTEHCEDIVDGGRLPGSKTPARSLTGVGPNGLHLQSGVALGGATDDQVIDSFQFAYCTGYPTGTLDVQVGFYDNLRGFCANGIPVQGKPYQLSLASQATSFGTGTAYFDFGAPSSFSLPGSTALGKEACWIVTVTFPNGGFCMASEGDGVWDNDGDLDQFSWSFQHENPNSAAGVETGVLIAGEPTTGGWGAGAYNVPVGPAGCGTGFDTGDGWWINVDGSAPGLPNTAFGGGSCPGQALLGSGCYWFGGWPGGPLGSYWMVLSSAGTCSGCSNRPTSYCTAGTSATGCRALISASGSSSSSATSGFFLNLSNVDGNRNALFYFGTSGPQANGWGNGNSFQCVVPPVKRTASGSTTTTTVPCGGTFRQDLNELWTQKMNQDPGAGAVVWAQGWYRDPANTSNQTTALSDGITWTVCP